MSVRYIVCPQCGRRVDIGDSDSGYIDVKCDCCGRWYTVDADELSQDVLIPDDDEDERPAENIYIWL